MIPTDSPYIDTPEHARAAARLRDAIERHEPFIWLRGEAGVGKTTLLAHVLNQLDRARWQIARATWSGDANDTLTQLADHLDSVPRETSLARLRQALRIRRLEGTRVLLALDADHLPIDAPILAPLRHLLSSADPRNNAVLVTVARADHDPLDDPAAEFHAVVTLHPLTRTQALHYLHARLAALGHARITLSPDSATLLHAIAHGIPRRIDRLVRNALDEVTRRGATGILPDDIEQAHAHAAA